MIGLCGKRKGVGEGKVLITLVLTLEGGAGGVARDLTNVFAALHFANGRGRLVMVGLRGVPKERRRPPPRAGEEGVGDSIVVKLC